MRAKKLKSFTYKYLSVAPLLLVSLTFAVAVFSSSSSPPQSLKSCNSLGTSCQVTNIRLANGCGSGPTGFVPTTIDFGCQGNMCSNSVQAAPAYCEANHNGITDLIFAIIRFLSAGVGLVVIASVIIGGIQYIVSRGDPNATNAAVKRLTSTVLALFVFLFAYAILNFVIPGGFFK